MGKVSKAFNKSKAQPQQGSHSAAFVEETEERPQPTVTDPDFRRIRPAEKKIPRELEQADTSGWNERLLEATRNATGVAEGIRKIRTMLLQKKEHEDVRSLMVLSSDPQEGKSFVCANLGISIAKSLEHEALILDCDLRRPSLHKLFGIDNSQGLADYLRGEEELNHYIRHSGLDKLNLVPSGSPPENPAELLSSERMTDLLEELTSRSRDRLIILDTPPFHAASETLQLSQLVDKIVLVVRWGKTGRENIKKMIETIGRDNIIGCVFNAFEMNILDRKMQGVGYHNYYSEYY